MKQRALAWLFALALSVSLLPAEALAANEEAAKQAQDNGQPYYIMVNRRASTVTVYGLDENGAYTVPVRAMVCSTGSAKNATPKGNFSIGRKHRWHMMMGDVYAQYLSQFYKECLFHSLCYARPNSAALLPGYYEALGRPASHGCIRLQTEDAKWIYENCGEGTRVTVYDSDDPGELGKPEKMLPSVPGGGWDPTDPEPGNPWAEQRTADIALSTADVCLRIGETAELGVMRIPAESTYPTAMFHSDDPTVAVVDARGHIRATGAGRTTLTVSCGEAEKQCAVVVTDENLPFCDVTPDEWYYADVRYLYERGLIAGGDDYAYAPDAPLQCSETLQLLYNFAGKPAVRDSAAEGRAWYANAADWAADAGITEGSVCVTASLTRQELIELLFRYDLFAAAGSPAAAESIVTVRDDAASLADTPDTALTAAVPGQGSDTGSAETGQPGESEPSDVAEAPEKTTEGAADWALRIGLLLGDDEGNLALDAPVTRAQMAALLHRYCEIKAA